MQRIIQINIAGRILPIEEDAYLSLRDYINSLHQQFGGDDGKEIIEDIENRIAELFTIRLQSGAPAIDRADVKKVMDTLGAASDLNGDDPAAKQSQQGSHGHSRSSGYGQSGHSSGTPPINPRPYPRSGSGGRTSRPSAHRSARTRRAP